LNSPADLHSRFDEEFTVEKMHYGLWQNQISDTARFNAKYDQILSELESKGIVVEKFY
jgi:hypothetical protein